MYKVIHGGGAAEAPLCGRVRSLEPEATLSAEARACMQLQQGRLSRGAHACEVSPPRVRRRAGAQHAVAMKTGRRRAEAVSADACERFSAV